MPRPLNLTDINEIRRLKDEGLTMRQIADKLNVSYTCVASHLRKLKYIDKQKSEPDNIEIPSQFDLIRKRKQMVMVAINEIMNDPNATVEDITEAASNIFNMNIGENIETAIPKYSEILNYLNNLSEYQKILLLTDSEFNKFIYKMNKFKADLYIVRSNFTKDDLLELKALILSVGYKPSHGDIIFNINRIGDGNTTKHFRHLDFEKDNYRHYGEHSKKLFTEYMEKYKGITFEQFIEHPIIRLLYIPFPPDTFDYVCNRKPIKCG